MKKSNVIIFTIAALLAGAAAGYFVGAGRQSELPVPNRPDPERGGRMVEDAGDARSVKSLRARVAQLEQELSEKKTDGSDERKVETEPARNLTHRERMEKLEKENPARYAQITNRIANWRSRRAESARAKIDFLSSIDTSAMSKKDQAVHEELQELVARHEELESRLHDPDIDDDRRRKLFGELRESGAKMRELAAKERDNLLSETARNLGFEGEDVSEIVSTVKEIFNATEIGWGPGRGRRPPGGTR